MKRSEVQVLLGPPESISSLEVMISVTEIPDLKIRGLSSVGRAPALQAGGQGFDPPSLHEVDFPLVFTGGISFYVDK